MSVSREVITGPDVPSGKRSGPGSPSRARQALGNLEAVLRAGGSRPELVVNTHDPRGRHRRLPRAERAVRRVLPDRAARSHGHAGAAAPGLRISIGCVALVED